MSYSREAHFEMEKELANELKNSSPTERRVLYQDVYNRLFNAFPEIAVNFVYSYEERVGWQIKLLEPLFDKSKIFVEIGAGDCIVSKALAPHFKKVIAYEVATSIPFVENKPDNLELKIFNGIDMHETPGTIDIIYSNQVFEHLHPDDTQPLLETYKSYLRQNGKVVIITPHRLTGPHDISKFFTDDAQGFHLKEYVYKDIKRELKAAGFRQIKGHIGKAKWGYIGVPIGIMAFVESVYCLLPKSLRKKLRNNSIIRNVFDLKISATKK